MIREPAVAGQFYPANATKLQKNIQSYLGAAETVLEAKAVVCPHAGYVYSGSVAGAVFSAIRLPKKFVILGPNHTGKGVPLAISPRGEWRTPLGMVSIDSELQAALLRECPQLREDSAAHAYEHSLEVQLPFIQTLKPDCTFAAICIGTRSYAALESLGHALARAVQAAGEPVLLVASSDMSHFESATIAQTKDQFAIERVLAIDPAGLYRVVQERDISMCGFAPTVAVLIAGIDLGATTGHLIRYTNSGEVSGDYERVVAYAGMAIT